jgi:hypothetical protein
MKLRDFRKQLREWPPLRTTEGDPSIHRPRKGPFEPGPARLVATSLCGDGVKGAHMRNIAQLLKRYI